MKKVVKLTDQDGFSVLVGVESIITAETIRPSERVNKDIVGMTKILSRGAMVETTIVKESVKAIYELINSLKNERHYSRKINRQSNCR